MTTHNAQPHDDAARAERATALSVKWRNVQRLLEELANEDADAKHMHNTARFDVFFHGIAWAKDMADYHEHKNTTAPQPEADPAPAQPSAPAVAATISDNRAALQKWEEVGYDMAGSYPADEQWESVWNVVLGDYEHGIGPFIPGDCLTSDAKAAFYRGWHQFKGSAAQPEAARATLTKAQRRELDDLNALGELTYNRKILPASFKMMQELHAEGLVELVGSTGNTATYKITEAGCAALDGAS